MQSGVILQTFPLLQTSSPRKICNGTENPLQTFPIADIPNIAFQPL